MSCFGKGSGIKNSRVNLRFVKRALTCLHFSGLDITTLGDKSFTISSKDTKYYIWYNLDGAGVDPAHSGTGIEVVISSTDSTNQVAEATRAAIDAITGIESTRENSEVQVEVLEVGEVFAPSEDIDSGIAVNVYSSGFDVDLGLLEGDIEYSFETSFTDITAHQTGSSVVDRIVSGKTVSISTVLLEFDKTRKDILMGLIGGEYTDSNSNVLSGFGSGQYGKSVRNLSGTLLAEPINGDSCHKKAIWLAFPDITSISHAQEDPYKVTIEWTSYEDFNKPSEIDVIAFGDYEDLLNGQSA